ncbi:MAG: lamin tail domain-containing protein [Planctomycetota bacterium]
MLVSRCNATMFLLATCLVAATEANAADAVRISQVYGGGGSTSSTAAYNRDYVEIFNSGADPVSLAGWTLEYGSAAGNWGSSATTIYTFPKGATIAPCQYLLIAFGTPSTGGAALPVTADFTFNIAMSATSGKVALFRQVNTNVACGAEIAGSLVDKVAYGTANCAEGTAAGALTSASGLVRNSNGQADTDDNLADFTITTPPVPRNAQSPAPKGCGGGGGPTPCPADLDNDGQVAASDLAVMLGAWGGPGTADLNGDGQVGAADLSVLLGAWGPCPS